MIGPQRGLPGNVHSVDMLDRGLSDVLGRKEHGGARYHHAAQKGEQFKKYELFISDIFHLVFQTKVEHR